MTVIFFIATKFRALDLLVRLGVDNAITGDMIPSEISYAQERCTCFGMLKVKAFTFWVWQLKKMLTTKSEDKVSFMTFGCP